MSKKLSLHGKTVEVSDRDYHSLALLGAEVGVALTGVVFHGEAAKQMRGPQRGHAPRPVKEAAVEKKTTDAEQLHSVVAKMRSLYRPKA